MGYNSIEVEIAKSKDRLKEVRKSIHLYLRGPRPTGEFAQEAFDNEFDALLNEESRLEVEIEMLEK